MSYDALAKRIAELRAAASPGPWRVGDHGQRVFDSNKRVVLSASEFEGGWMSNANLAAPAHEMAACVEALVRIESDHLARPGPPNCVGGDRHYESCPVSQARVALDALAKAML